MMGSLMSILGLVSIHKRSWLEGTYCIIMVLVMVLTFIWSLMYGNNIFSLLAILSFIIWAYFGDYSKYGYYIEIVAFINIFIQIVILL